MLASWFMQFWFLPEIDINLRYTRKYLGGIGTERIEPAQPVQEVE
jgi:hypothetical protein